MPAAHSNRTSMIQLIHVAKRDLALDDDAYQAIIQKQANGKTSSGDCTTEELDAILRHMKRSGFRVRHTKPKPSRKLDTSAEASKVRALWLLLHQIGEVRDPSESALASYCKRIAKVDDLHWAGAKIYTLIETLKKWAQRKLPAALSARMLLMQQSGLIDPRNSVRGLCIHVAPKRDPETFDPMWWAWNYLNNLEREHGYQQTGN